MTQPRGKHSPEAQAFGAHDVRSARLPPPWGPHPRPGKGAVRLG